jgi:hypothetical protein
MPNQTPIVATSLLAIGVIICIAFGGMAFIGATPTQHASHTVALHYRGSPAVDGMPRLPGLPPAKVVMLQ